MIRFFLLVNRQGKTRLSKWYVNYDETEKNKLTGEIHRRIVTRDSKHTNFVEFRNYKIIYRRYAGLYFVLCVDVNDNELVHLEFIHLFVEVLDQYFGNVVELDIVFNFHRVYGILDEMIIGGEIMETSKSIILVSIPRHLATLIRIEDSNRRKMQKLEGLMGRKNNDPDLTIFTIGMDLTNFGLNLTDSEKIYPYFGSPFSTNPTRKSDAQNYNLPQCYLKPQISLNKQYFKKFPDETLFYVFYNYGEEAHRYNATEELYGRGWKYHYPTETWIGEQEGVRKYFNTLSWQIKNMSEGDINEEEYLTLDEFKLQSNPQ